MKCPYCGKELRRTSSGWLICDECKIHMPESAWKKRIEKKAERKREEKK